MAYTHLYTPWLGKKDFDRIAGLGPKTREKAHGCAALPLAGWKLV